MRNFSEAHNDYLDPDLHGDSQDDFGDLLESLDDFLECVDEHDQSNYIWHLYETNGSEKKLIDTYNSPEKNNALACDMHDWMVESGHYGKNDPEEYDWDGDGEFVAIMGKNEGMTNYCFEWKEPEEDS
jgi:hypothetical protein